MKESIGAIHRVREEGSGDGLREIEKDGEAESLLGNAVRDGGSVLHEITVYAPKDLTHFPTGAALLVQMMGGLVVSDVGANMGAAAKDLVHMECEKEWKAKASSMEEDHSLEVITDGTVRSLLKEARGGEEKFLRDFTVSAVYSIANDQVRSDT